MRTRPRTEQEEKDLKTLLYEGKLYPIGSEPTYQDRGGWNVMVKQTPLKEEPKLIVVKIGPVQITEWEEISSYFVSDLKIFENVVLETKSDDNLIQIHEKE
jgi:hypothetical protein